MQLPGGASRDSGFRFAMLAGCGIQAGVGEAQALDRRSADDVRCDNLFDVGLGHASIPNRFGIDDDRGAVFALVEAAGLVDAHAAGEAGGLSELLQLRVQLALAIGGAGWARRIGGALIVTDEDVTFK
jgi:hypothetical protein